MPPIGTSLSRCENVRKMTKLKLQKSDKINPRSISQPHAYLQSMVTTSVKFQKYRYPTVGGAAHTRYPLIHSLKSPKNDYVQIVKEMTKNNPRIIIHIHAYLQTMPITHVKFENNWYETLGGFAQTRYPLSIHFYCQNAQTWLSSNCKKVTKINLRIISKPHGYFQSIVTTSVKFQENRY